MFVNTKELERDGIVVLNNLLTPSDIAEFEAVIDNFCTSQLQKFGINPQSADPFVDIFTRGGVYADRVYKLLERLHILHRMSMEVGEKLEAAGFFEWADVKVPLVWPDIRADLPNHTKALLSDHTDAALSVHQDFSSTRCHTAWRLWIPLRPANAERGSMRVYKGTHKLGPLAHNVENPLMPIVEPHNYADLKSTILDLPAGDGVLFSPLLLHASVANRSNRVKFTLLMQIQDLATMADPEDEDDDLAVFARIDNVRARARIANDPRFNLKG